MKIRSIMFLLIIKIKIYKNSFKRGKKMYCVVHSPCILFIFGWKNTVLSGLLQVDVDDVEHNILYRFAVRTPIGSHGFNRYL